MKTQLADEAKKAGIEENTQAVFAFLVERVRANLHVVLCMSPVGEAFRLGIHTHRHDTTTLYTHTYMKHTHNTHMTYIEIHTHTQT